MDYAVRSQYGQQYFNRNVMLINPPMRMTLFTFSAAWKRCASTVHGCEKIEFIQVSRLEIFWKAEDTAEHGFSICF